MVWVYALLTLLLLYILLILPTQWLKIERVRYPLGINRKIVQISDLHAEKLRISPERLLSIIEREKPDFIAITGDFTRNDRHLRRVEPYLKAISISAVPAYAVLGNHDYRMRKITKLLQLLKSYRIPVLRNEMLPLDGFQLVGIDDFCSGKSQVNRSFQQVDPSKPVIVLTHDPNVVPHIRKPFHYLMAGHLHGKQFNIPFFFKIKYKGELPAKGIYKGFHKGDYGAFYISKGIGQAGINARLFVRSEITVHSL
ncbi:metallophosphoesterase [Paenibacillus piri]|uniref:Metallophosphoesterase n=1 Tax=Paenibacillus piri TaxID=2547395 RepID=A0A4R5KYV2_9BACL|nr:metallophosphoesterase [Paenibacillus piri]TDG00328.1 metallophosphoesterase [Paenibacillus piri]